jgi:hypothetical protein
MLALSTRIAYLVNVAAVVVMTVSGGGGREWWSNRGRGREWCKWQRVLVLMAVAVVVVNGK